MKARKPSGQILIIFETDLSQAKSLDEEKFTPIQKAVYDKLSGNQKEQIKQGYGAVYRDIDTDTEICSFNMDCYRSYGGYGRKVCEIQAGVPEKKGWC